METEKERNNILDESTLPLLFGDIADEEAGPVGQGSDVHTCCQMTSSHVGLIYAFISCIFFAGSIAGAKLITTVHPFGIYLVRMAVLNICITPAIVYNKVPLLVYNSSQYAWLILRGICGCLGTTCIFTAVRLMPVGDAVVIFFSIPVCTAFLSCVCLKELITLVDIFFALLSVAGVVVISKPSFLFTESDADVKTVEQYIYKPALGAIFALVGALFISMVLISSRKLGKNVNHLTIIFYFSAVGMVTTTVFLYALGQFAIPFHKMDWIYLIFVGLCGVGGQILLTKALQIEKAVYVAIIRTMDIVFAYLFQYFWFGRKPDWTTLGGAVLVIASSVGITLKKLFHENDR
ncbi:solute carrier family 35 member G1-like [Saccoglossus kowalevskii]|uniref:Solute carrier family 35 member G1-like n=1 Tax=Saccoglossus kowalevskii TaxID=10224 RepID=A0ABM0GNU3_SACKO|nr:PREDICTED: solute carrier family 35 member G1-like [Saccoglossus kowalevskii]